MKQQTRFIGLLLVVLLVGTGFMLLEKNETKVVSRKQYKSPVIESNEWVENQLKQLSLKEKIGQSFMVACWSNNGEAHLKDVESYVVNDKIGGIIFFQGERDNLVEAIDRYQQLSNIPLFIGMDAEWGVAMRLFNEDRFPYQQTIGAANDVSLTKKIGFHMGLECEMLGINMTFSPVADVNSNPNNPVIGFRAFGSNANQVAEHTAAMVEGIEETGVVSCTKHFPGHGDTDKDSHKELPTVSHTAQDFENTDFKPFEAAIKAGTKAIMVAHLRVPKLDPSGTPSSLSKAIIQHYLREKIKFNGLVISDALNMKAVSEKYGKEEVCVKAYQAGCDILLFPESVSASIQAIEQKVLSGEISKEEVDQHCRRVLLQKYETIVQKKMVKRKNPTFDRKLAIKQVYEKAAVCLKNNDQFLPFNFLNKKTIRISIGTNTSAFRERLEAYMYLKNYRFFTTEEAVEALEKLHLPADAKYIIDLHSDTQRARTNYGFGNWKKVIEKLPSGAKSCLVFFGNPMVLKAESSFPAQVQSVICGYENTEAAQQTVAELIVGALNMKGKLAMDINDTWKIGSGIHWKSNGRLQFSLPEAVNINRAKLQEIDDLISQAISAHAFPGCQVVVAVDGKIILQKAYGTTMYEKGDSVTNEHLYDLASITKIASTTTALMKLQSQKQFNLKKTLGELVPEYVSNTPYAVLKAEDLLTHQAGLTPWIAFYKSTMKRDSLDEQIYSPYQKHGYSVPVAANIWIKDNYWKTMLQTIVETPLSTSKTYKYSDLSYYFFQRYIEKVTKESQNLFVEKEIYAPLGLKTMTYLPLEKFEKKRIVPTENDQVFRRQLIHGYVHDPGAAMMGGVAGHAGLFSNATDLAALMQFLMNKGQVGTESLIDKEVVEEYTACRFCPQNRRGIGFDKPTVSLKNGPTSDLVSPSTFGHSGFTGTITWADPENKVVYVFLSNRVYPDAENWKITKMNVRTEIQRIIYEALFDSRK